MASRTGPESRQLPPKWRRRSLVKVRRPAWAKGSPESVDQALAQGDGNRMGAVAGTEPR
jgi:hypothetical protein